MVAKRETDAGYRPDIDGLRAVAVLAIVAFHAWPQAVTGGFVGVDVFFVISGFLITRIIAGDQEGGRFSFGGFYLRRARRILPAYFTVTGIVACVAALVLLPGPLAQFGAALAASGLFITNAYFLAGFPNYFAPAAHEHLLLHLWSLAVEEQFYLVWPLALTAATARLPRRVRDGCVLALLAGSLVLAQAMVTGGNAAAAFFLLPTRAWEFLLGALLALGVLPPLRGVAAEAATGAGLLAIGAAVILFDALTPFPGLSALAPCGGAALVIWAGQAGQTRAAAVLRSPLAVGVGKISYSLYLWHWPLLTLARTIRPQPLSHLEIVALLGLAVLLSVATWRWVEQPWRRRRAPPRRRDLAHAAGLAAVLLTAGAGLFAAGGLPGRLSAQAQAPLRAESDMNPAQEACFTPRRRDGFPAPATCGARPNGRYEVLVWGDSHADALAPGVAAWAGRQGLAVRQATKGACPPLLGTRVRAPPQGTDPTCERFNARILSEIAANPDLKLVVLSARWPVYVDARPKYGMGPLAVELQDARRGGRPFGLDRALAQTLNAIAASGARPKVLVIGPTPELPFAVPACMGLARHLGLADDGCQRPPAELPLARAAAAEPAIRAATTDRPFALAAFPAHDLCRGEACVAAWNGAPLYFDSHHLTATAAVALVPRWMEEALRPGPGPGRR